MKKAILILQVLVFSSISVYSQKAPVWNGWIYKNGPPEHLLDYVGLPVDIVLEIKNDTGAVSYIEHFTTTILTGGYVGAQFGTGTIDPNSPSNDYFQSFRASATICPTITIHDPSGDIVVGGYTQFIGSTPKALFSEEAINANALGGNSYDPTVQSIENNLEYIINGTNMLMTLGNFQGTQKFNPMSMDFLFDAVTVNSAVTGNPLNLFHVNPIPACNGVSFGSMAPTLGESRISFCSRSSADFYNTFAVKSIGGHAPALNHPTAAIYAENIEEELGVGLYANGASRGTYSEGQTGVLGLSVGTGSGAGVWARVQTEPSAGGFKYGLYAENQGFANTYAAYLNGNSIYTGTLTQTSDARLKTNIATSAYGLSTILKLRPTQYQYLENTPYNFPDGTHQGFLAQEVEEVLPELVEDVTMPNSFDPAQMSTRGTTSYKTVNYIEMIPILTSAIQELNAKVDAQAIEIAQLKKELVAISKNK